MNPPNRSTIELQSPRAFLSFRHVESEMEQANVAHRAWVTRLAQDLGERGIDIIWGKDIQQAVGKHSSIDLMEVPLCQEISRTFPALCDVFVAIITPAYLERLGVVNGRQSRGRISYGVVFEEWQGMGANCHERLIPLVRRGHAHQINMSKIASATVYRDGLLDFRSDNPAQYAAQLNRLANRILAVDTSQNVFSIVEIQIWCDTYVEWCKARFQARNWIPVDIWWFDTNAANEFLSDVSSFIRDQQCYFDEINSCLIRWQAVLRERSQNSDYRLRFSDVAQLAHSALLSTEGERGWQRAGKTAEFCTQALKAIPTKGDFVERSQAYNNAGVVLRELAAKQKSSVTFQVATNHFLTGLADVTPDRQPEDWLRLQTNLASALKSWSELDFDKERLKESRSCYEAILRISSLPNDSPWKVEARSALQEMGATCQ